MDDQIRLIDTLAFFPFHSSAFNRRVLLVIYMAFLNLLVKSIFSLPSPMFSPKIIFSCLFTQTNLMITQQQRGE